MAVTLSSVITPIAMSAKAHTMGRDVMEPVSTANEASPMQKAWKEEIPPCAPRRDENTRRHRLRFLSVDEYLGATSRAGSRIQQTTKSVNPRPIDKHYETIRTAMLVYGLRAVQQPGTEAPYIED